MVVLMVVEMVGSTAIYLADQMVVLMAASMAGLLAA